MQPSHFSHNSWRYLSVGPVALRWLSIFPFSVCTFRLLNDPTTSTPTPEGLHGIERMASSV